MVQVSEGVREGMRKYWDTVEVLPVSFIRQNASRADAASSLVPHGGSAVNLAASRGAVR